VAPSPSEPAQGAERSDGRQADALPERLDGWKAIAGYLGRDIRTVQRWELSEGLPVRRLEHKQRSSAYAYKADLDTWLHARSLSGEPVVGDATGQEPPPQVAPRWRRRRLLVLGTMVATGIALAVALVTWWPRHAQRGDTGVPDAYVAFAEGEARYLWRRYREAAISLERAVTLDPGYGKAWAWLAKTYGRLAQPVWAGGRAAEDRAGDAAARAAQLAPDLPDAHIALALAARARGDVGTWRKAANRALELDARAAEALALLADSYSAVIYSCDIDQDPELAESYYRRAMDLMPSLTTTASNRAGNLRRLRRYAECVEILDRTMRDYPDQTPLLGVRGACRLMLGDVEGATADIAPLRNNPRMASLGSLIYLSLLALKTGRTEEGVRDLEAFTTSNHTAPAELIAAETYALAGQVDRAVAHVKRAIALDQRCAGFVAKALAFAPLRDTGALQGVLPGGGSE
jgi:tetratricopeptide (TPR) repeat protein